MKQEYYDKKISPFGQCPIVSIGDSHMAQTNAIFRYFAKMFNMYGDDAHEEYLSDMILDGVEDWRRGYVQIVYNKQYNEVVGEYVRNVLPKKLVEFECLLKENVEKHKLSSEVYSVGGKLNMADIMIFDMLELSLRLNAKVLAEMPLLNQLHKQIAARPNIAKYLASGKRPSKMNNSGNG